MKKRIAVKIVKDRVLPAIAPLIAAGDGIGPTKACYSDRERRASRVFVRTGLWTRRWQKDVLAYDPFSGDQGDAGDRELRDKIVFCRKPGVCDMCGSGFRAGAVIRLIVMVWAADGFRSYRYCRLCCDAMASSWTDDGNALDARHQIRKVLG